MAEDKTNPTPPADPPSAPAPAEPTDTPGTSTPAPKVAKANYSQDARSQGDVALVGNSLVPSGMPSDAVLEYRVSADSDWYTARPVVTELPGWISWRWTSASTQSAGSGRIRVTIAVNGVTE